MFRVFFRLIIFSAFVAVVCMIPYALNSYSQKNLLPKLLSQLDGTRYKVENIKMHDIGVAFPFGLQSKDYSFTLLIMPEDLKQKKFFISGDAMGLTLASIKSILQKQISFNLFINGTVIISDKDELKEIDALRKEPTTDLAQVVVRRVSIPFTCSIETISVTSFTESITSCFKSYYADKDIELQEMFYDLNIEAEKRFVSIKNFRNGQMSIHDTTLAELHSIYRNTIDFAQIKLLEKYPIYLLQLYMIKKLAEDKTRTLDVAVRNQKLNYGSSYFYYLLSGYYGPKLVDDAVQFYTTSGEKGIKDNLSSALLGKLSRERNISSQEFLTPGFLETFTKNAQ